MLPVILYVAVKWWAKRNPRHVKLMRMRFITVGRILAFFLAALIVVKSLKAQDKQLNYSIYRGDSKIGALHVECRSSQGKIHYKMESSSKTRLIILLNVSATEESIFENGNMVFSSIHRRLNGHEKVNRKTELLNNRYITTDFASVKTKNFFAIDLNTHGLFFLEPFGFGSVYSENFQRLIPINAKGENIYELSFPDGSVSTYYYRNHICFKIEIHSPLFSARILLDDPSTKDYSKN